MSKENNLRELDYKKIRFSEDEVDHARGVVAANAKDADDARHLLEHLGLMPGQEEWRSD